MTDDTTDTDDSPTDYIVTWQHPNGGYTYERVTADTPEAAAEKAVHSRYAARTDIEEIDGVEVGVFQTVLDRYDVLLTGQTDGGQTTDNLGTYTVELQFEEETIRATFYDTTPDDAITDAAPLVPEDKRTEAAVGIWEGTKDDRPKGGHQPGLTEDTQ